MSRRTEKKLRANLSKKRSSAQTKDPTLRLWRHLRCTRIKQQQAARQNRARAKRKGSDVRNYGERAVAKVSIAVQVRFSCLAGVGTKKETWSCIA